MHLLILLLLLLLLLINLSSIISITGDCYNKTSCVSCVGTSLNPLNNNCEWCSDVNICINQNDINTSCPGSVSECQESYYTIIFIIVVTALGCLCFGTCCLRRIRLTDDDGNFISPIFNQFTRNSNIFRSSTVESEWMCIICGFDNKYNNEYCTLCGTSQNFSREYKTEKITQRRKKRLDKNKKDIKIPADAQISNISLHTSDILQSSLSQQQRAEIFNYRRLNQLTLRQKSARRRKMWQRIYDEETDEIRWIRCPVKETKVGNTLFGYSPHHSFDDTFSQQSRITSYADDDNNSINNSINNYNNINNIDNSMRDPLLGNKKNNFNNNFNFNVNNSFINSKNNDNYKYIKIKKEKERDSFDDVICSGSPGFTSVFGSEGELQWEKVETGNAATTNIVAPVVNNSSNNRLFSPAVSRLQITFNDLEAAAILPYRDKQG